MHAGQDNLGDALLMQRIDLVDDRLHGAAIFFTARHGDDAECTAVTATVLHFNERALPAASEQRYFSRLGGQDGHAVHVQFSQGFFDQLIFILVADYQVNAQ